MSISCVLKLADLHWRPPGLNWSPTINNHFLITQSPMRIPLFTDQHLRLLDLRSRSQQLESQFIVWSGRAENLNPTLEQELNSYTDATFALGRLTQLTCIHVDIIQRHVIWLRWRLLNLGWNAFFWRLSCKIYNSLLLLYQRSAMKK